MLQLLQLVLFIYRYIFGFLVDEDHVFDTYVAKKKDKIKRQAEVATHTVNRQAGKRSFKKKNSLSKASSCQRGDKNKYNEETVAAKVHEILNMTKFSI